MMMRTEGSVVIVMASCALVLAGCASLYYTAPTNVYRGMTMRPRLELVGVLAITVSEAAEMAVGNSPDLRAEREGMHIREGAWKLGLRSYFPSIEMGASSDERLSLFGSDSFTKTVSIGITQPVWDGGRLAASRALESAEIFLARAELERKSRDVGEAAVSAYRSVIADRKSVV